MIAAQIAMTMADCNARHKTRTRVALAVLGDHLSRKEGGALVGSIFSRADQLPWRDIIWPSGARAARSPTPPALCVAQMLNHETHHRDPDHKKVTEAGGGGWANDLAFMPQEGPWH